MWNDELIRMMKTYENLARDLDLVRQLELPHWYIAAGYVRNFVWDQLHGYPSPTPLNDIDVIYYDNANLNEAHEKELEAWLNQKTDSSIWSVKNQARMHLKNGNAPYVSITDAISRWPETVTAVGITLNEDHEIEVIAPYGVQDIFQMKVRRSPLFPDIDYYRKRVQSKKWQELWPKIQINWE